MRDRRDDERSFRGPMGVGRDSGRQEDRFRDRDRDREWERERSWRRDEDMGGSGWSGASGRGGYETREEYRAEHGGEQHGYDRDGRSVRGGFSGDIADRGPHYGKGPKGYKRSDERIREDVCDCIARQGYIDASDVEVKVESGIVVLSGTVGQRLHKRVLEQMAERLLGVDDVRNELRLRRDEQTQMRGRERGAQQGAQQNGDQNRQSNFPNGKSARA